MKKALFTACRKLLILSSQALMVVMAFLLAVYLRHDCCFPSFYIVFLSTLLLPLILIKLISFALANLMSGWWRYVSIHDLVSLIKANLLGSLLFAGYLNYSPSGTIHLPASVLILDGVFCFLIMSGTRVTVRLFREYLQALCKNCCSGTENVLIVGAGAAGQSIAREIRQTPQLNWKVVGFSDQDHKRAKQRFQGIPVLSTVDNIETILHGQSIDMVILANPALSQKELRNIITLCQKRGIKSKILPNVRDILNGDVSIQHVRDVKLDDLLGRPPVKLDVGNIREYLGGKRIMVTGAAGSIGSEICRQVAEYGASCVILFDNAETPLFQIDRELKSLFPSIEFIPCLKDVRDAWQVDHVFQAHHPQVVFHAAAYKHVPMSENNPLATLKNNVLGSQLLVNAADRFGVEYFVMVSTDKAVNPTNTMGASKRAAEVYAQALAQTSRTRIVTVRFGNVLGSNGSVVPIFNEQIRNGGPVTVTDPKVTRFFMTIPEAVQLVLQAGSMGEGGEIFILDMGEQVKIVSLAEELIRLSGMAPYRDIDIVFTGLRPGEKMHEELLHDSEGVLPTKHEKICVAQSRSHDLESLKPMLEELAIACRIMDKDKAFSIIAEIVPEYGTICGYHGKPSQRTRIRKSRILNFPINVVEAG